jgi:hypothetical protein
MTEVNQLTGYGVIHKTKAVTDFNGQKLIINVNEVPALFEQLRRDNVKKFGFEGAGLERLVRAEDNQQIGPNDFGHGFNMYFIKVHRRAKSRGIEIVPLEDTPQLQALSAFNTFSGILSQVEPSFFLKADHSSYYAEVYGEESRKRLIELQAKLLEYFEKDKFKELGLRSHSSFFQCLYDGLGVWRSLNMEQRTKAFGLTDVVMGLQHILDLAASEQRDTPIKPVLIKGTVELGDMRGEVLTYAENFYPIWQNGAISDALAKVPGRFTAYNLLRDNVIKELCDIAGQ